MTKEPNVPESDNDEMKEAIEKTVEAAGMEIMPNDEFQAWMAAGQEIIAKHDVEAIEEGRRFLDEKHDQELIETWRREAKECRSIDEAAAFAKRLITDYRHDYGTICHAIAAAGVAMANAVERSPAGGITGFQAGAVGWMLHRQWEQWGDEPRRMVDYSHLLYPQYDEHFTTISSSVYEWLTKEAEKKLAESPDAHPDVIRRWRDVASGRLPAFLTVEAK